MAFHSFVYIFVFMPVTLFVYFCLGKRSIHAAQVILIAVSLTFYGLADWHYIILISASMLVTAFFKYLLQYTEITKTFTRKTILCFGVGIHIFLLVYIKYLGLIVSTISQISGKLISIPEILLPVGVSFFTFKQIAYLVDTFRCETAEDTFLEYCLYICFFPMLLQGPIALRKDFIPQLRNKIIYKPDPSNIANGVMLFSIGLVKKVLIADVFEGAVSWGFNNVPALSSMDAWILMFAFSFQIYFDFSGYCDMAAGSAKMFNLTLPTNFNSPYKALSIDEFWKKWHMTLTGFFRNYVYFPLGGNRRGTVRTCFNIILVFFLSGLWHGANVTFVAWGIFHGIFNIAHKYSSRFRKRLSPITRWMETFLITSMLWLLFRAESITQWISILSRMIRFENLSLSQSIISNFDTSLVRFALEMTHLNILNDKITGIGLIIYFLCAYLICVEAKNTSELVLKKTIITALLTAIALVTCMLFLNGVSEYIYFDF